MLFRDGFSLDLDDIASLVIGVSAAVAVFRVRRSKKQVQSYTEIVDAGVLQQFRELTDRISKLERNLEKAQTSLDQALVEIQELHKLEEFLQAKLHEREKELASIRVDKSKDESIIKDLKGRLRAARRRIGSLESELRREE